MLVNSLRDNQDRVSLEDLVKDSQEDLDRDLSSLREDQLLLLKMTLEELIDK